MELRHNFINLKKLETQTMEDYLRHIKAKVDALVAIQSPVTDLELIYFILSGLNPEYDTIATTILLPNFSLILCRLKRPGSLLEDPWNNGI